MNNYFDYKNLYNTISNMGNIEKNEELYNPYEGFIRGNMFPELYEQYKIKDAYNINPANEQAKMLTNIDALGFAAHDITLYLSIYPDNKNMIEKFNLYKNELNKLMNEYQNKYGPLLLSSDSLNSYPWAFNDSPWPWETR